MVGNGSGNPPTSWNWPDCERWKWLSHLWVQMAKRTLGIVRTKQAAATGRRFQQKPARDLVLSVFKDEFYECRSGRGKEGWPCRLSRFEKASALIKTLRRDKRVRTRSSPSIKGERIWKKTKNHLFLFRYFSRGHLVKSIPFYQTHTTNNSSELTCHASRAIIQIHIRETEPFRLRIKILNQSFGVNWFPHISNNPSMNQCVSV